jgi:hypothetical protein
VVIDSASERFRAEAEFQNAYARFLTDEIFRGLVLNPVPPGDPPPGLSDETIDRLRKLDQHRVELFAQCLFGNRMAAIEEAFPLTVRVIGEVLPAIVRALDAVDVAVDTRKYPEAIRFADFVLNAGDAEARALPDSALGLLGYELIVLNLRVRPQFPEWPDSALHSAAELRRELRQERDIGLVLNRNHALVSVGYDVEMLRELPLDALLVPEAETDIMILLHRGENGAVHEKRLNPASAAAILMIEEAPTFREFVSAYKEWLSPPSGIALSQELRELCISLCDCGALGFEPGVKNSAGNARRTAGLTK